MDDASLQAGEGEIICLWGKSGTGKSTLLRGIAGLEPIDSGDIRLFGHKLSGGSSHAPIERSNLGMNLVFQDNALISNQTVRGNISLPLIYKGIYSQKSVTDMVDKILTSMLIFHHANDFPHNLSLGVQKRVAIARSLIDLPKVLLMDEPTAGLDHSSKQSLLALLYNYQILNRLAVLMVTHDLDIALSLNAKVAYLSESGKLYPPKYLEDLKEIPDEFLQEAISEVGLS